MIRKQVVIEESQNRAVTELARQRGVSVSELIRELIDREIARGRNDRVRKAAEALREEYLKDPELQDFAVTEIEELDEKG